MTTNTSVSAANLFIDLATFAELEAFLYGGPNAITWFVASVQKANWFSYLPITLRATGTIDFGQKNVSASVNRSGDYVLAVWFRCQIPQVVLNITITAAPYQNIRWCANLMHNIFERVQISFNELVVQEFDSFWLDFNYQFRLPSEKRIGYQNMIGNISSMTGPVAGPTQPLGTGGYFSCPLPFWFAEDSGIALPVAALPFNDIKINYNFRQWQNLIIFQGLNVVPANVVIYQNGAATTQPPAMQNPATWAHYAVVHNDERIKMGDAPRDILIHQVQSIQYSPFKDVTSPTTFDVRLSHSIVVFCFAAQNTSISGDYSNYTTEPLGAGLDPLSFSVLTYENTARVAMGSDYYSFIAPYYIPWGAIPDQTGYHAYYYGILPWDPTRPSASTNYSKLANVSITHTCSAAALAAANGVGQNGAIVWYNNAGQPITTYQTWNHIFIARNWNIVRVANGSLGMPTL